MFHVNPVVLLVQVNDDSVFYCSVPQENPHVGVSRGGEPISSHAHHVQTAGQLVEEAGMTWFREAGLCEQVGQVKGHKHTWPGSSRF